ncbi:MAG: hypothetical protein KBS80_02735 [Bacteroidales bacterium]|nr:hypothetical protein [Candidatus Cryptobacteroides choladohippi]
MEEEKKLYPFKFCTLQDEYAWGTETFCMADLGYRDSLVREGWLAGNSISEIMDTYLDRVVGDSVYDMYGRQFPVCIRQYAVKGRMPLRVHPDDETASQRFDALGKEKLWYVLRAGKDSKVMLGFRRSTDGSELFGSCADGSVENLLNIIAPHAGQFFRIPPGTPHAAEGDIDIIEIGESSAMDFCLCSWDQPLGADEFDDTLTIVDALDFIDYRPYGCDSSADGMRLLSIPQFEVNRLELASALEISSERLDSFVLLSCISGAASVQMDVLGQTAMFPFTAGQTVLVPCECTTFRLVPSARGTVILETTIPPVQAADPYINPAAEESLDDEDES